MAVQSRPADLRRTVGALAGTFALGALLLLGLPAASGAADDDSGVNYREFVGRIDRINKKKMIVDNRMGDKLTFEPADAVAVVDSRGDDKAGKEKWRDLKKNDWVSVSWLMMDHPRKAYKVTVMPEKEEAGDFDE